MGPMDYYDKQAILLATQRHAGGYTFRQSLDQLLGVYWRAECSDPRDKVYALLGLVYQHDQARTLEIDYSITTRQLYDLVREKGYVRAETLRRALGHTEVDSEGQVLSVGKRGKTLNNVPSHILFHTQGPTPNHDVTWLTDCNVQPGDTSYSFPGRKCSIIFRQEHSSLGCIGTACVFSLDSDYFPMDLKDLEISLLKRCLFDNAKLEITDTHDDGRPRYYAQMPSLLFAAVESYTSLRQAATLCYECRSLSEQQSTDLQTPQPPAETPYTPLQTSNLIQKCKRKRSPWIEAERPLKVGRLEDKDLEASLRMASPTAKSMWENDVTSFDGRASDDMSKIRELLDRVRESEAPNHLAHQNEHTADTFKLYQLLLGYDHLSAGLADA